MAIQPGEQVYVSDETLYRTKDGRIVGEGDPDKLTKVTSPGQKISMARARELGLVTGEGADVTAVAPTGREDKVTSITGRGAPADRTDKVRSLTPGPETKVVTKAPARPRKKQP